MDLQQWLGPLRDRMLGLTQYLPNIVGALLWIGAGWICARLVRTLSRRIIDAGLGRLERRPSLRYALETTGARASIPRYTGVFLFWSVWLFFAAAAAETLGLPVITGSLNRFAHYLPNVLAAVVILFAGLVAGNVLSTVVTASAEKAGIVRAPALGSAAQITMVLVSIIVALEQLGINGDVLVIMFAVVLGVVMATGGLAFGLGARVAVGNLIASHYVALAYQPGQTVLIDDVEGTIAAITSTAVLIDSESGRVSLPAQRFLEAMSVLRPAPGRGAGAEGGT